MSDQGRVTLRLTNQLSDQRTVVLEPWTGEYKLRAQGALDIVLDGNRDLPLQIELNEDRIIVYCFDSAGAQVAIFRDGKELTASEH